MDNKKTLGRVGRSYFEKGYTEAIQGEPKDGNVQMMLQQQMQQTQNELDALKNTDEVIDIATLNNMYMKIGRLKQASEAYIAGKQAGMFNGKIEDMSTELEKYMGLHQARKAEKKTVSKPKERDYYDLSQYKTQEMRDLVAQQKQQREEYIGGSSYTMSKKTKGIIAAIGVGAFLIAFNMALSAKDKNEAELQRKLEESKRPGQTTAQEFRESMKVDTTNVGENAAYNYDSNTIQISSPSIEEGER